MESTESMIIIKFTRARWVGEENFEWNVGPAMVNFDFPRSASEQAKAEPIATRLHFNCW